MAVSRRDGPAGRLYKVAGFRERCKWRRKDVAVSPWFALARSCGRVKAQKLNRNVACPVIASMETTTSNLLTRILQAGLAFLLILAPIPFGSVQEEWIFVLEFGIFLLAGLWIFHELARGRIGLVQTGLYWPLLL